MKTRFVPGDRSETNRQRRRQRGKTRIGQSEIAAEDAVPGDRKATREGKTGTRP